MERMAHVLTDRAYIRIQGAKVIFKRIAGPTMCACNTEWINNSRYTLNKR